ncbi:hypothetical protein [Peribacillus kribbensis]|uniref:hypothetical protein n=1 Tax=Peribacillus kribbensis TaxID=356658 RepID=UPI00041360A6|nr:hypothetical protein [Peribacillus kribbensis]
MKTNKLKKATAGIALAALFGSSVPGIAGAHEISKADERYHSQQAWNHHHEGHHYKFQNKYNFLKNLEQGDKLGLFTVGSVVKGDDSTTVSLTGDVNVKGSYNPQNGQFSLNRFGFKHHPLNGFSGKNIEINNQSDIAGILNGQSGSSYVTGTLTNIQLAVTENGLTISADLKNVQKVTR